MTIDVEREREVEVEVEVEHVTDLKGERQRQKRLEWNGIENELIKANPNYIPCRVGVKKRWIERGFFILYEVEKGKRKAIGKATATIDRRWIELKGENTGFIDDFIILAPDYLHRANELIEACVGFLKDKGVESVFARSCNFPALRVDNFDALPVYGTPSNSKWCVDAFREYGFTPIKDWRSFRLDISTDLPENVLLDATEYLNSINAGMKKINFLSAKELIEYGNLLEKTFLRHFGYNPQDIMGFSTGFKRISMSITAKLLRFNIYLFTRSGEIFGFFGFYSDLNLALKNLYHYHPHGHGVDEGKRKGNLVKIPRYLLDLRRIKRARVGNLGLAEQERGKGVIKNLTNYFAYLLKRAGFREADTGPMLCENIALIRSAEKACRDYKKISEANFSTFSYEITK